MEFPEQYKKHIKVERQIISDNGDYLNEPKMNITFDNELTLKVNDAVKLLEDLHLYNGDSRYEHLHKESCNEAETYRKKISTVQLFSFIGILWCFAVYYSIQFEKNNAVAFLFLLMITAIFIYLIYLINKKERIKNRVTKP